MSEIQKTLVDLQLLTLPQILRKKCEGNLKQRGIGKIINGEILFYTNEEYLQSVRWIFHGLAKLEIEIQCKIAILGQTSMDWHLFDLGIQCHRSVVIPIYPSYLSSEVLHILNHSESKVLIVENEMQLKKILDYRENDFSHLKFIVCLEIISDDLLSQFQNQFPHMSLITYDNFLAQGKIHALNHPQLFNETISSGVLSELSSIIYTSGTTGEPKGAMITQGALTAMLNNVSSTLKSQINSHDRNLIFLPLSHVLGRCDSFLNLIFNMESIYAESLEKVIDNLTLVKPTILIAVPRIFEKVYSKVTEKLMGESKIKTQIFKLALKACGHYYDKINRDISPEPWDIVQKDLAYQLIFNKINEKFGGRIRFLISGGAPIAPEIIKFLQYANLSVIEGYGLTETIAPCTLNPLSRQIPGTIGVPLGDVQIKIASDGEILIKTQAMFCGYYKNEAATKEAFFEQNWFMTGDIGEITADGYIKITDRKKDIIITSAGKNVAPQKIENLLKLNSTISQVVVIGDQRKFLTAIVTIDAEFFMLSENNKKITYSELAKRQDIYQQVEADIRKTNHDLASYETVKGFIIAPTDFSVESGEMTPSLKVKKKVVISKYKKEIDELYLKLTE